MMRQQNCWFMFLLLNALETRSEASNIVTARCKQGFESVSGIRKNCVRNSNTVSPVEVDGNETFLS
jgi:hypothetical protein